MLGHLGRVRWEIRPEVKKTQSTHREKYKLGAVETTDDAGARESPVRTPVEDEIEQTASEKYQRPRDDRLQPVTPVTGYLLPEINNKGDFK